MREAVAGMTMLAMLTRPNTDALAQDTAEIEQDGAIEDIVVTAERRETRLQETPLAITAISAETIEHRDLRTARDVARLAPNLVATSAPQKVAARSETVSFLASLISQQMSHFNLRRARMEKFDANRNGDTQVFTGGRTCRSLAC